MDIFSSFQNVLGISSSLIQPIFDTGFPESRQEDLKYHIGARFLRCLDRCLSRNERKNSGAARILIYSDPRDDDDVFAEWLRATRY